MKDLRPPTLQTYTDKTYTHTQHRHTLAYTIFRTHRTYVQTLNTRYTHTHANMHTIPHTRILAKSDCAILRQIEKLTCWHIAIAHVHLTPTGFNCHGAGIWTVVCSNEGPPALSRISSVLKEGKKIADISKIRWQTKFPFFFFRWLPILRDNVTILCL